MVSVDQTHSGDHGRDEQVGKPPDEGPAPGLTTPIIPEVVKNAVFAWAAKTTGPFGYVIPETVSLEDAQSAIFRDPRIYILAQAAGIERHLDRVVTNTEEPYYPQQYPRNALRIVQLLKLYSEVADAHGTPDLANALAAKLELSGLTAALVGSASDGTFAARYQAALTPFYVSLNGKKPDPTARLGIVVQFGNAAQLSAQNLRHELAGQEALLFIGAARMNIVKDFPCWNTHSGNDGPGTELFHAFEDSSYALPNSSTRLMSVYSKDDWKKLGPIIRSAALWSTYESDPIYDNVQRATFFLGISNEFPAMKAVAQSARSELYIFGRDPTITAPVWFNRPQRQDVTYREAETLATALKKASSDSNPGAILKAFDEFERYANAVNGEIQPPPLNSITTMLRSLRSSGITLENAHEYPQESMAAAAAMLLFVNRQIVEVGYYIHADTVKDPICGFNFSSVIGAPVVAQRYIRTPSGDEFDQVIIDAAWDGIGYDMPGSIDIPIKLHYIHQQIDYAGRVYHERYAGSADLNHEFKGRFCTVFLKEVNRVADDLGISRETFFHLIADHEADHGMARHVKDLLQKGSFEWVDHYRALVNEYAPAVKAAVDRKLDFLSREDAPAFIAASILEMSAIIREACVDLDAHRRFRNRHLQDSVPVQYLVPPAIIDGALHRSPTQNPRVTLTKLYEQVFGIPMTPLDHDWVVLPCYRSMVPGDILRKNISTRHT